MPAGSSSNSKKLQGSDAVQLEEKENKKYSAVYSLLGTQLECNCRLLSCLCLEKTLHCTALHCAVSVAMQSNATQSNAKRLN